MPARIRIYSPTISSACKCSKRHRFNLYVSIYQRIKDTCFNLLVIHCKKRIEYDISQIAFHNNHSQISFRHLHFAFIISKCHFANCNWHGRMAFHKAVIFNFMHHIEVVQHSFHKWSHYCIAAPTSVICTLFQIM